MRAIQIKIKVFNKSLIMNKKVIIIVIINNKTLEISTLADLKFKQKMITNFKSLEELSDAKLIVY